ncbi:hypothetical protein CHU93_14775 [Sandarakinorhabdus cyanobacteriorum]|uniref:Flagellar protein FlgJ N-terminal domain-containing protein n=1 Tax=Sandarakinorhabdus cyanobacteriorum TaxID=1981098 RepID=A0A255Y9H2_9SPHN|nr:hypothetical protein [Sandarakinorhabdus cyanobacteriorum]OYQ25090.1 hypothetical protein CHU93_14775 [Sandarakinorhabdus cyanobacteriorum]
MQLQPPILALPALLQPGQRPTPAAEAKARDKAAGDFEALLVTRLLKTARSAKLGDDLMGGNDQIRDLIDEQQGRIIAGAAPLGLAQLLAKGARP